MLIKNINQNKIVFYPEKRKMAYIKFMLRNK